MSLLSVAIRARARTSLLVLSAACSALPSCVHDVGEEDAAPSPAAPSVPEAAEPEVAPAAAELPSLMAAEPTAAVPPAANAGAMPSDGALPAAEPTPEMTAAIPAMAPPAHTPSEASPAQPAATPASVPTPTPERAPAQEPAPEPEPETKPTPSTGAPWPADCDATYRFVSHGEAATDKFTIPAGHEVHPQIMFDIPWTGDVQAIAFRPVTDNPKVLHHWILYGTDGSFLAGWAPGADETEGDLPADVGMYLPSSGQLRLDMHYNNLVSSTPEQDGSGVEVCVIGTPSKFRPNTATVIGIIGNASAPARKRVDNTSSCTVRAPQGPATLLGTSPHMHTMGVHAKLELIRAGQITVLHDAPFVFDQQHTWPLEPRVKVESGDELRITCSYQNDT
ncbi:MAG: hypothetical protein ABW321_00610, partial [Polyangiales bacterium]